MNIFTATEFEGHIYLDHYHPPILWNIVRGGFSSVDMLPECERNFAISVSLASMLQNSSSERLLAELALESTRQSVAPSSVSRLRGLFVFDEIESVAQIWSANSWGAHFQDEYLVDVGVYARNSTRVDANWIAEVISEDGSLKPSWEVAAINYWSGAAHPGKSPIWERIVDGTFCILSMHSKKIALREIEAIWPESIGLLVHSMNCFAAESLDGQCFPTIEATDSTISLDYHLRMVDSLNPQFIEWLRESSKLKPKLFAGIPDATKLRTPDLTGYSAKFSPTGEHIFKSIVKTMYLMQSG